MALSLSLSRRLLLCTVAAAVAAAVLRRRRGVRAMWMTMAAEHSRGCVRSHHHGHPQGSSSSADHHQ